MAGEKWLSYRKGAAGGSVPEDEACRVRGEDGARIKEVEM
jgi:hypothetical protein